MKIGILGLGIVGSAVHDGLQDLGHEMSFYDKANSDSYFSDISETDICFICVPTPSTDSGSCDTGIVEEVVSNLHNNYYDGIIAIKSTVEPGTTQRLIDLYNNDKICFVPEFLRERCAFSDFVNNQDLCVIGTNNNHVFEQLKKIHGNYPDQFKMVRPTEAEIIKYYNNIYNSTLIILANSFFEICNKLNVDYDNVKDTLSLRKHINDQYLKCNNNFRGFGGACLPKDTKAIAALCKKLDLNVDFFDHILAENSKYKKTVYHNMRK